MSVCAPMGRLHKFVFLAAFTAVAAEGQNFALSGTRSAVPGGATVRTFASPNGRFQLTLEEANPTRMKFHDLDIVASVWKPAGNSKEVLWTTRYTGSSVQFLAAWDVHISDDGDFFLLTIRSGNEVMLYKKDVSFSLQAAQWGRERPVFLSFAEHLTVCDALNGQKIVRIWDRDRDAWNAFDVADGKRISAPPSLVGKWNDTMRREILDRLVAAERERLRRKVTRLSAPLRRLARAAMGTNSPVVVREIDYEFLTSLRNPDDRKWIEALLKDDDPGDWRRFGGRRDEIDRYMFEATDVYKVRADWLLGIWDKKAQPNMAPQTLWGQEGKLPRFALGKVSGTIRFAIPINLFYKRTAGVIRVKLLPAETAEKLNAPTEAEIEETISNRPQTDEELVDEVSFNFTTVRPGSYKLKAIWDARPGFADTNMAGPGDYESGFSKTIRVTAGNVLSNVVLHCTNRAPGGESYYAMDEVIRKRWTTGEYARFTFAPDKDGGVDTFSRHAPLWITRTNAVEDTNVARIARIGLRTWKQPGGTQIARPDTLVVQFNRRAGDSAKRLTLPGELHIVDEHGCVYENKYFTEWKNSVTYTFFSFPRSAQS